METQYKIVFTGRLLPGFRRENVIDSLVSISNMDKKRAQKFLSNTGSTVIQKNLDKAKAEKYLSIFQKAGLEMRLSTPEPPPPPIQVQQAAPAPPPETPSQEITKKKPTEEWLDEPRVVPASHGLQWLKSATVMFLGEPWKWMGMTLVAFFLQAIISVFPFFGSVLSSLLAMIFAGGMMLAAHNHAEGKSFQFNYIFKGFQHNRNQLILAGAIYLCGFMAIALIIGLIMAISLGASFFSLLGNQNDSEIFSTVMINNIPIFFLTLFIGMILSIPLVMGAWFAAPLVAIHDRDAWQAFKLSIRGCTKNWIPFLIYGLALTGFGLMITIVMGGMSGLLVYMTPDKGFSFLAFLPILAILLMGFPLMVICGLSVYTSFRDIYYTSH